MAKRALTKKQRERLDYDHRCKQCQHSYEWQNEAVDGHLILCRCQHYNGGKYLKFLNDFACEHFLERK